MKNYFKFFVAVSIFTAIFGVAPFAFADPFISPGASTTPQPFTVTCDPYTTPFVAEAN